MGSGRSRRAPPRSLRPAVARYLTTAAHARFDAIEYLDESRVVVSSAAQSALQEKPLCFSHELGSEDPA